MDNVNTDKYFILYMYFVIVFLMYVSNVNMEGVVCLLDSLW
jgi:hypothetical protein